MSLQHVHAFEVREYDPAIAAGIGLLMPQLDPRFDSRPMTEEEVRGFTDEKGYALVAAVDGDNRVVGTATLSTIKEQYFKEGYLGGVVTVKNLRGQGIGSRMMRVAIDWVEANDMEELILATELDKDGVPDKPGSSPVDFYRKLGAKLMESTRHMAFIVGDHEIPTF